MKFCGYSSVQTTGIEKSFLKLNILQAERTRWEEEEEEKKKVLEDELAWEKYQQSSERLSREGTVDTVVTEFVTSYPHPTLPTLPRFAPYQFYSIIRQDTVPVVPLPAQAVWKEISIRTFKWVVHTPRDSGGVTWQVFPLTLHVLISLISNNSSISEGIVIILFSCETLCCDTVLSCRFLYILHFSLMWRRVDW